MEDHHFNQKREEEYTFKLREEEELEFFTELAIHESERWIQAVTKKTLQYPEDTRKSLENGILLCELLNCLQPGSVNRINRLPTPIAGLDNINVFLKACRSKFGISDVYLFNPSDLEDLSQRAIAESASLKHEYERRLRNVVITIYWLGKYAGRHYHGPQLDLSAYSELVHHRQPPQYTESDHPEEDFQSVRTFSSRTSSVSSADWGNQGGSWAAQDWSQPHETSQGVEETRRNKHTAMSFSRYSSTSVLNRSHDQNSQDCNPSADLVHGTSSHRRYSSNESLEGSYNSGYSGHSRQGSDSLEVIYPTRRLTSQSVRRQSSTTDPLQFIKGKTAQDLAHTAEVQMRVAAESKKGAIPTQVQNDDESDWQAKLTSWKNRRKSHSDKSFYQKEDQDQIETETGSSTGAAPQTKTFSQMQVDRERRRSTKKPFYPLQDDLNDGDDEAFTSSTEAKQLLNSSGSSTSTQVKNEISTRLTDASFSTLNNSTETSSNKLKNGDNDANNNYSRKPTSRDNLPQTSFDESNDDNFGNSLKHRQGLGENLRNQHEQSDKSKQESSSARNPHTRHHAGSRNGTETVYKTKEALAGPKSLPETDIMIQKPSKNIGSRTQSKIGDILKNFEDSSSKISLPKEGYREKIDLNARKSAFENASADNSYENMSQSEEESGGSRDTSLQGIHTHTLTHHSRTTTGDLPPASTSISLPSVSASRQPDSSREENDDQGLKRKVVKISQKPNSEKGFGFSLSSGGSGRHSALYVSKVVLGSAADICDLKAGDRLLTVNQTEVSGLSPADVGDLIKDCVSEGCIEVQVLRAQEEDDIDDFNSSSDGEEGDEYDVEPLHYSSRSRLENQTQAEARNNNRNNKSGQTQLTNYFQESKDMSMRSNENYHTESDDTTMRSNENYHTESEDTTVRSNENYHTESLDVSPADQWDSSGSGPPAILRKWQQQQEERCRKASLDNSADVYQQIRVISLFSIPNSDQYKGEPVSQETPQDLIQSRPVPMARQNSATYAKELKEKQEEFEVHHLLEEKDKGQLLEERKAQRRARISQSVSGPSVQLSQPVTTSTVKQESWNTKPVDQSYISRFSNLANLQEANQQISNNAKPTVNHSYNVEPKIVPGYRPVQLVIDTQTNQLSSHISQATDGLLNKPEISTHTDSILVKLLEEERERLRQEELRKIEEEKLKVEEELRRREQGEKLRLQKEEELLRKEKEQLQLEREWFLREKEEFNRLREQQLRDQQRLEQQMREQQLIEKQLKEQHALEQHLREQQLREQQFKDQQVKEQQLKEQQLREQQLKEKELKEQQLREQQLQEQQLQEQTLKEQQLRDYLSEQTQNRLQFEYHGPQSSPRAEKSHSQPQKGQSQQSQSHQGNYQQKQGSRTSEPTLNSSQLKPQSQAFIASMSSYSNRFPEYRILPNLGEPDLSQSSGNRPQQEQQQPRMQKASSISNLYFPQSETQNLRSGRASASPDPQPYLKNFLDGSNNGATLSKNEKLAMNRTARPSQQPLTAVAAASKSPSQVDRMEVSLTREAPSKKEIHSLNSVPLAKLRSDTAWQSSGSINLVGVSKSGSLHQADKSNFKAQWHQNKPQKGASGKFSSSPDHWLVEEAERRRLAQLEGRMQPGKPETYRQSNMGPIQPADDSSNRWRGHKGPGGSNRVQLSGKPSNPTPMPAAIRQTVLQRTAGFRGSTDSLLSSSQTLSSSQPPAYQKNIPSFLSSQALSQRLAIQSHESSSGVDRKLAVNGAQSESPHHERSMSGSRLCSHCDREIGYGNAMFIENLDLYVHVQCFKCCVCHASLGSGDEGTEVRVRANKLHCPNCYSNDEAGLKFSKV